MNMHRASSVAEWTTIPENKRNHWQRLAHKTHGYVTPGNFLTVLGLVLVLIALVLIGHHHYWYGLAIIIIGRLCDLWDGMAAEATGTKSSIGEALDAGFDKLATLATFIFLITSHVIGLLVVVSLLVPNLLNALATIIGNHRGIKVHPSKYGKWFMASSWVALAIYILLPTLHQKNTSVLAFVADVFLIGAIGLGLTASYTYFSDVRQN